MGMTQEDKELSVRYQIYGLDDKGKLDKPITIPIDAKRTAMKYYTDCIQCALVAINEHGTVVEILAEKKTQIYDKKHKTKTIKMRRI